MLGAATVAFLGTRLGFKRSLFFAYFALLSSLLLLAFVQPVANFVLIGAMFGFSWNLLTPYQFEAVTRVDSSSSAAMLVNASTLGGIAVGPAIAGFLVSETYLQVNLMGFAACFMSLIFLIAATRIHRKRQLGANA